MDRYFAANAAFSKFSVDYMKLKKGLPIRPSEMGVLNILAATPGPHTSVMLAELLGVSKPMITAYLTALLEKGYITKEQSQDDKRVYHILPTAKAMQLVEDARADTNAHLSELVAALGQEDFDRLVELTQKASQVLENDRREATKCGNSPVLGGNTHGSQR